VAAVVAAVAVAEAAVAEGTRRRKKPQRDLSAPESGSASPLP
jgi:hypothetical protein